jgi:hypothetical protein
MSPAALHRDIAINKGKSGLQAPTSIHDQELKGLTLETSLIEGV